MKKTSKLLALMLVLVLAFSVLAACANSDIETEEQGSVDTGSPAGGGASGGEDPAPEIEKDYTLAIGVTTSPMTHDPTAKGTRRYQMLTIYERLLAQSATGELVPALATEWEYLDELTLQVKLRDDVYFTDGQHMTANDVLTSYRDYWAQSHQSGYFVAYDWDKTEIIDDYTINFAFNQPYGPAVTFMGAWYILCEEDMSYGSNPADSDKWMSSPNGTSPYYCVENVDGSHVTYARKDAEDYWGELPECTEVTYKYYSETATMYIDFETGTLDAANAIGTADATRVLAGDCPDFCGYYVNSINDNLLICLPEETAVFDDINVRKAFWMSVDRESISIAMYGDLYLPADSLLPDTLTYYVSQADKMVSYDPEGAKALLAEAGYPDGISLKLIVTQDMQVLAEALQASLSAGGIEITVESYDSSTAIPMFQAMESDFICKQAEGGAYIDEAALLLETLSPTSTLPPAGMTDPVWVAAFDKAHYNTDSALRAEGFEEMQEWAVGQYRILPVCTRANMTVYNTDKLASFVMPCADEPLAKFAVFN